MEKTHFGESVFGDDDDVKKNELKTRGGCSFSSTKTGDQKACRIVASSNARRRQTDRISKTKKDIISLDPASRRRRRKMMINNRETEQQTEKKKNPIIHRTPTTTTTKTETTMKARTFLGGETTTCAQEEANIFDDVCVSVMCRFYLSGCVLLCFERA